MGQEQGVTSTTTGNEWEQGKRVSMAWHSGGISYNKKTDQKIINDATTNFYYANLAGLLGIMRLNTSICRASPLFFSSATPRLSVLRSPFEYTTVKSGTTSPGAISLWGVSVQCCHGPSAFTNPHA